MTHGSYSRHKNIALTVKYPTLHALAASYHSSLKVEKIVQSVLRKKKGAVEVQKGAKRVLFPPDIDHQLPKFDGKCYVFMAWIRSMRHAEQPVPSSLPEISMFWPSTTEPSGPVGWQFGALKRSKKITISRTHLE